jgi:hypothetical protein
MATQDPTQGPRSLGEKLQSLPRQWLYLILIACATIPAFFSFQVPGETRPETVDFFNELMALKEGDTVLIETDWTKSTRGESMGQFEALMRILMRKKVKFAFYSIDPQAPQVAEDTLRRINDLEKADYQAGRDYVRLGYFPNAEAMNQQLATDLRKTFESKTVKGQRAIDTPVLKPLKKVEDAPLLIIVTASKSFNVAIERLNTRVRMLAMVTGVMVPESLIYYSSKQIKGMSGGLKGVYDLESLMQAKWPDKENAGKGKGYYPTLHVVLTLMILTIITGNVGMMLAKRRRA